MLTLPVFFIDLSAFDVPGPTMGISFNEEEHAGNGHSFTSNGHTLPVVLGGYGRCGKYNMHEPCQGQKQHLQRPQNGHKL